MGRYRRLEDVRLRIARKAATRRRAIVHVALAFDTLVHRLHDAARWVTECAAVAVRRRHRAKPGLVINGLVRDVTRSREEFIAAPGLPGPWPYSTGSRAIAFAMQAAVWARRPASEYRRARDNHSCVMVRVVRSSSTDART